MRRVDACADNAAMESFFSLLQKTVLNRQRWPPVNSHAWRSWSRNFTTAEPTHSDSIGRTP
jgi:hypothetical protein